jgi:Bacterioferritin (cytochrome b1)
MRARTSASFLWGTKMSNITFIDDMSSRRARARRYMIGCSASHDEKSQQVIIDLLNEALATKLICVMRYKAHYFASHGFAAPGDEIKLADTEFKEHVAEEQRHVERIAERINELGGFADFNPPILAQRGYSDYTCTASQLDLLKEDLIGERIAIDIYREMIRFVAGRDPQTRDLLTDLMSREKEHADRLEARIQSLRPEPARRAVA